MRDNIITAAASATGTVVTQSAYQYDYGLRLEVTGIELPAVTEWQFANSASGAAAKTTLGDSTGCDIPNDLLISGEHVYAWLFIHETTNDGFTVYTFDIPVIQRTRPVEEEPTPEQAGLISQAIAALNEAVEDTTDAKEAAETAATDAAASAVAAGNHADAAEAAEINAQNYATDAQGYANAASASAGDAEGFATAAATSETNAASSATSAADNATAAGLAKDSASASATSAAGYATSASASATTAGEKAVEASASATAAAGSATAASGSADDASDSAIVAAGAATDASASATTAAGSATSAANSATAAAGSATAAAQSAATAASTVSGAIGAIEAKGAEVIESIPEDYTELSADVTQLKSDLNDDVNRIYDEFAEIPKERRVDITMAENTGYLFTSTRINAYETATILTFPVRKGVTYHIESDSYKTNYATYPVAVFSRDDTIAVGNHSATVIIEGIVTSTAIDETYTPENDGYIWINHLKYSGDITAYYYSYGSDTVIHPILYEKKIAVLGDSIMQYMSGGYGGENEQTFVENGHSHTYEEITITDGIPYYNGNECQVVNEKQSYYDSQGWQYLQNATQASQILNCSIGGSVLAEGTISTPYPGYEQGTHHTNSLPNLVKWLFRMCENTTDPDLVVIWMGTNGLGGADGDIDEIFALPWETLSSDAGHTYRQTNIGALRYAIERIYREMPHTYILVLGPIQADPERNPNRSFANLLSRSNTMKNVAQRISVKFIEALTEIEVYGLIETQTSNRYLSDGLHLTDAGKRLFTDFLNKKINSNYQYKY